MAKWLKQGKSEVEIQEADSKVRSTVEQILSDVSKRGDDAVRELSKNLIIMNQKILSYLNKK